MSDFNKDYAYWLDRTAPGAVQTPYNSPRSGRDWAKQRLEWEKKYPKQAAEKKAREAKGA